jgi:hypothetical protein
MGSLGGNLYPYVSNSPLNFVDPSGNIIQVLSPDSYVDLGFVGYSVYRILVDNILNDCDNLAENLASLGGDLLGLAIPGLTGVGASISGAKKATLVIGKLNDLDSASLKSGETVLSWTKKATPQANWQENSRLLREAIGQARPIRDASINPVTGALENNTGF